MNYIATCAFGLEAIVEKELKDLGIWVIRKSDGRVEFEGETDALVNANLWLRCADRVLIHLADFKAETFDELFDQINALPWQDYLQKETNFPILATSTKSALHSCPAIQSISQKAVIKKLQKYHNIKRFPQDGPRCEIYVKINKNSVTVGLNSSGYSLHRRGYRSETNSAPIKETMAAALIKLSDWQPGRTLLDPFCGSGTIPIEAAMIAKNIPPGLNRDFAFENWHFIDREITKKVRSEARTAIRDDAPMKVHGSDLKKHIIEVAITNARNAGIRDIEFTTSDFRDLNWLEMNNTTIITNPPYGERLSHRKEVDQMYADLGNYFGQTTNTSLFLLTSHPEFTDVFGSKPTKNRKLYNGKIQCYLYQYQ